MTDYITHASDKMEQFSTGSRRGTEEGKMRVDLLPPEWVTVLTESTRPYTGSLVNACYNYFHPQTAPMLAWGFIRDAYFDDNEVRLAKALYRLIALLERGAAVYGDNNWQKGQPDARVRRSLKRHVLQYYAGIDPEEDHFAAVLFNLMVLWWNDYHGVRIDE